MVGLSKTKRRSFSLFFSFVVTLLILGLMSLSYAYVLCHTLDVIPLFSANPYACVYHCVIANFLRTSQPNASGIGMRSLTLIRDLLSKDVGKGNKNATKQSVQWAKTTALHALHVRFTCRYISLPSSAKQRREMIKICGLWRTSVHDEKQFIPSPNFNAVLITFILANYHVE